MINNKPVAPAHFVGTLMPSMLTSAVINIQGIREADPFRSDSLYEEMGTYAAHALDVIERHAGFDADLETALGILDANADVKMRWARIKAHREEFIVFRDLSMFAYRAPIEDDVAGLTDDEKRDLRDKEEKLLCRTLDFMEDDMHHGLLPIVLMLNYGAKQQASSGVALKLIVEKYKASGESLNLVCRMAGQEASFGSSLRLDDLSDQLRGIFDLVEERVELLRVEAYGLPAIRRPEPQDMGRIVISEFEVSGVWSRGPDVFYWPPYLSRPVTTGEDVQRVSESLAELAEMALWACPQLPDEMSIELLSAVTSEGAPTFTCLLHREFPRWRMQCRASDQAVALLGEEFCSLFKERGVLELCSLDFPVGHRVVGKQSGHVDASGITVATMKVVRPNARRAFEIDGRIDHSFEQLPGYVDPAAAAELEERLLGTPSPLGFPAGENEGKAVLFRIVKKDDPEELAYTLNMAVAGGDDPELMARLVSRAVCEDEDEDEMSGYEVYPFNDGRSFSYSIVVGAGHDINLRRPMGYVTISGSLDCKPGDQAGG